MIAAPTLSLVRRFGLLLLLTVALHAAAFTVELFNPDEAFVGTQARVVLDGGSVYDDTADRKAPALPYLYAAAFAVVGDDSLVGPRLLAMLALALTAFLVFLEGRARWGERAGWVAGLLCVFAATAYLPGDGQAASFELFMLPATVGAVVLARHGRWASAGAAVGLSVLVKQTGGVTLLPVASRAWRARQPRPFVLAALGFAAPVVLAAVLIGPGEYTRWNVLGTGGFAAPPPFGEAVQLLGEQVGLWIGLNAPLVLLLALAWRDRRHRSGAPPTESSGDNDLWIWLVGGIVAVALGWRFYGHYFLQLVPPVSLLAAGALARRSTRVRIGALLATGATATGCALGALFAHPADIIRPELTDGAARAIRAHSGADDRVLVWGLAPELYWEADRLPATRFVTTLSFLAGVQPSRDEPRAEPARANRKNWDDFLADFDAHQPRLVLDTAPAALKDAELAPMSKYSSLAIRIVGDYCFVREVRGMHLYERHTRPDADAVGYLARPDTPIAPPCGQTVGRGRSTP